MDKVTMTVAELAQAMGVSVPKAYALVHSDGFPSVSVGRRVLIPVEAFRAWIAAQTKGTAAQ